MCVIWLVQLASTWEVFVMAWFEMRMYLLKQLLDHLPRLMISHLGQPIAAAVVAAPILREWEVVLARPSVTSESKLFISFRVRNLLFLKVKSGPLFGGLTAKYLRRAVMGHNGESFAARWMVVPWRNGSVLDALMFTLAMLFSIDRSVNRKVVRGSYLVRWVEVYSDTLRKPKKAVVMADQSISLSSYGLVELKRFSRIR